MSSDRWLNRPQLWSLTPEEVNFIVLGLKDLADVSPLKLKRPNREMAAKLEQQLAAKITKRTAT